MAGICKCVPTICARDLVLLNKISAHIGREEVAHAEKFLDFLLEKIRAKKICLENAWILVGYGGGKDSSWAVAFLRLVQLLCRKRFGKGFKITFVTMVHLGMPRQVFWNVDSVYSRLGLYADADVELRIFCYGHKAAFSKNYLIPRKLREALRTDVLLAGHRYCGNPRGTFCTSCNLHLVNSSLSFLDEGIDFILSGDSLEELNLYWRWLQDVFTKLNLDETVLPRHSSVISEKITKLTYIFFKELLDDRDSDIVYRLPPNLNNAAINPTILSVFGFTEYDCARHWDFLTGFLGFKFYPQALNFTESDCGYPLLMAHLRGLTAEIDGRSYAEGIRDYLELANDLMKRKQFPPQLIALNNARYSDCKKIDEMRAHANAYSSQVLGLGEKQLRCLVHSPFTDSGKRLLLFLRIEAREWASKEAELRACLDGSSKNASLETFLEESSGLKISQIRKLYASPSIPRQLGNCQKSESCQNNVFRILLGGDPHKKEVKYLRNGQEVTETIYGR